MYCRYQLPKKYEYKSQYEANATNTIATIIILSIYNKNKNNKNYIQINKATILKRNTNTRTHIVHMYVYT